MDFTFTEEQETIAKLARDLFELGTALPESLGGNGGGFVDLGVARLGATFSEGLL